MIRVFLVLLFVTLSSDAWTTGTKDIESIKKILKEIQRTDQETRKLIVEKLKTSEPDSPVVKALWEKQNNIDLDNQNKVAEILDNHGWPKAKDFGSAGPAQTIFLVIQHADYNFQKKYFEMVKLAVESGDVQKSSFALLQDRMLTSEGKEQLYGSQVKVNDDGTHSFFPIQDEANVDKRRAEVGLEPLAAYARHFGIEYK